MLPIIKIAARVANLPTKWVITQVNKNDEDGSYDIMMSNDPEDDFGFIKANIFPSYYNDKGSVFLNNLTVTSINFENFEGDESSSKSLLTDAEKWIQDNENEVFEKLLYSEIR